MGRFVVVRSQYCTGVVAVDVKAVEKELDDLLAPVARSPYEDMEPDYEFLDPALRCTC
jgi:hypothetical protein